VSGAFPRTFLFVPGDRPQYVRRALESAAEAIVFDLEDAVAPDRKAAARDAVRSVLGAQRPDDRPLFVRVNAPESPDAQLDLHALKGVPVAGLVVPKVETTTGVRHVVAGAGGTPLVLLIETPRGVLRAIDLAEAAHESLAALAFGAEDFRAAMHVDASPEADVVVDFARAAVAVAAAAADVPAIDAPELDLADPDGWRKGAARARAMGFRGKFAIHPAQLAIIHETLAARPAQRDWAERVIQAYEQGSARGLGSVRVDDRLVDAATVRRARQIVDRSRR
jgi:citrate lyase subunit beta/citryl-CoA lyase